MAATRTFLQAAAGNNSTTFTFTAQNLGAEDAGRYIVVCCGARLGATARTITSVTVGGVTADIAVTTNTTTAGAGVAIALVPTGATGDVVVTWSGFASGCVIQLYRVLGIGGTAASDTDTSSAADPSVSLDVPAGGVAFGTAVCSTNASSASWSGLTEDYDAAPGGAGGAYSSASGEFATQQTGLTVTCDFSVDESGAGAFASWAPSGGGGGSPVWNPLRGPLAPAGSTL